MLGEYEMITKTALPAETFLETGVTGQNQGLTLSPDNRTIATRHPKEFRFREYPHMKSIGTVEMRPGVVDGFAGDSRHFMIIRGGVIYVVRIGVPPKP